MSSSVPVGSPGSTTSLSTAMSSSINTQAPPTNATNNEAVAARRRTLTVAVACLLQEAGCTFVENAVLGTLVEILQGTLVELGRSAKGYCEVANRTQPLLADIVLALSDMGINYDGLHAYSRRVGRSVVPPPQIQQDTKQHTLLEVGDKKPHPSHIPEHLPQFPDTHTYCFTPTVKQPVTEYEAIREKAASQKRDIERALTKFATKTNPTESIFIAEDKEFSLVCVCPGPTQNIDALMPKDQVFEAELDYEVTKARKKRHDRLNSFQQQQLKQEQGDTETEVKASEPAEVDVSDNPYLRPVKMPRKTLGRANINLLSGNFSDEASSPPANSTLDSSSQLGPNISRIVLGAARQASVSSRFDEPAPDHFGDQHNVSIQSDNLDVLSNHDDDSHEESGERLSPLTEPNNSFAIHALNEHQMLVEEDPSRVIQEYPEDEGQGQFVPLGLPNTPFFPHSETNRTDEETFRSISTSYSHPKQTVHRGHEFSESLNHGIPSGTQFFGDDLQPRNLSPLGREQGFAGLYAPGTLSFGDEPGNVYLPNSSGDMSFIDDDQQNGASAIVDPMQYFRNV